MNSYATLVGFIRCMPDVHTFAIPVFRDAAGFHMAQHEKEGNGIVSGFQEVDIDVGFNVVSLPIENRIGNPMLYAFETSADTLAIGSAGLLSEYLQRAIAETPEFQQFSPHTAAATRRFSEFAQHLDFSVTGNLLYLLSRRIGNQPPVPVFVTCEPPKSLLSRPSKKTISYWPRVLMQLLSAEHCRELAGHSYANMQISALIDNSPEPKSASADLALALSTIDTWCKDPSKLCKKCLLRLRVQHLPNKNNFSEKISDFVYEMKESDLSLILTIKNTVQQARTFAASDA